MKFQNFYIFSFITCFLLSILVKVFRENLYGIDVLLDIVLGSSPSFLYLFGLSSLLTLFTLKSKFHSVIKNSFILMLGALSYEVEQYWYSRMFDFYDVIATVLAFSIFSLVHIEHLFEK